MHVPLPETVRFYRALSLCGTDFSMMSSLFPHRTRVELKAKFKREDRRNPSQISSALSCQVFNPDEGFSSDDEEKNKEDEILKNADKTVIIAGEDIKKEGRGKKRKKEPTIKDEPHEKLKRGRPTKLWDNTPRIKGKTKRQSEAITRKLLKSGLRFDESDPLGFKVLPAGQIVHRGVSSVDSGVCVDTDANKKTSQDSSVVVSTRNVVNKATPQENTIQMSDTTLTAKTPITGIKPLPYRVPGPGGKLNIRFENHEKH